MVKSNLKIITRNEWSNYADEKLEMKKRLSSNSVCFIKKSTDEESGNLQW